MSDFSSIEAIFPIDSIQKVYTLFSNQLASDSEPNLALFSIIVGAVENRLTCAKHTEKDVNVSSNKFVKIAFPTVEWEEVRSLYERFSALVRGGVDSALVGVGGTETSRALVKRVADVVWNSLTRSYYKDRAHLQSIYSLLTGNKLDCFGVAFAVTAGCQLLGKSDVHLALSEDHAWVIFGKDGAESAEVTWHGKGAADRRGRAVVAEAVSRSWLYAGGRPVRCGRVTELAAIVSAINPALSAAADCHEVAAMQHRLLWLLYNRGHLDMYPMALGNLGELDEWLRDDTAEAEQADRSRPDAPALYAAGIRAARAHYGDRHVYPYTFQGAYYYRHKMYKEAFHAWAQAGDVIRYYNYSRDDEEIYKEFAEIANELIPQLMKAESSGHSARSILKDPECFASLLRFYDGICKWEEGSVTPILHIGWAKPLVSTIAKFDATVRAHVHISCAEDEPPARAEPPDPPPPPPPPDGSVHDALAAAAVSRPRVPLRSHKMAALRWLLRAPRLNAHALQLQLTAQTQPPRSPTSSAAANEHGDPPPRAKRQRRDK